MADLDPQEATPCALAINVVGSLENHFPAGPPEPGQVFGLVCLGVENNGDSVSAGFALVPLPFAIRRPGELMMAPTRLMTP